MNRRFPLAGVLRVRRVQEDLARADVAQAQAKARVAERHSDAADGRLAGAELPDRSIALAFTAAACSRTSLALEASGARLLVSFAHDEVDTALAQWRERAMRVDGLETLEARHRAEVQRSDLLAEQHVADDLSGTAWRRNHLVVT